MLIPEVFYGTSQQVRQRLRKVVTEIRRGKNLPDLMDCFPAIHVKDHPDALLSLGAFWEGQGGEHFMLRALGKSLASDRRLDWADVYRTRDESVDYLASTPWGTLVLNCPQQYYWILDYPINRPVLNRRSFIAILEGTMRFWELYESFGPRFHVGAWGGMAFWHCKPLVMHVFANCDLEHIFQTIDLLVEHLPELCRSSAIVERLKNDDDFWRRICENRRLNDEA